MANEWYYAQNNQQQGPVSLQAIQDLLRGGQLQSHDLVWRAGMGNWMPASQVPEVSGAVQPAPQAGGWQQQSQGSYPAQPQPYYNPPGYPPGGYGAPQYADPSLAYAVAPKSYNGLAVTSFVLSLVGLVVCGFVLGIVSIVLGAVALNGMKTSGNNQGKGLSIAGIIIGVVDIIAGVLIMLVFLGRIASFPQGRF